MTQVILETLRASPALGVLVLVVFMFLRAQDKRDGIIKQLHDEHMAERAQTRQALRDCTASNISLISCINKLRTGTANRDRGIEH